jgi:hypothetical protein
MTRAVLLASVAFLSCTSPGRAAVEPTAAGEVAIPKADERDGRMRTVPYVTGQIIRLVAARGQTLLVELPPDQEIATFLASDQDVMDATPPAKDEVGDANRGVGGREQEGVKPCSLSSNLQICVRRDRFIAFKPITDLDPQPVHLVAVRTRPNGKVEEIPYLFELVTTERDAEGRARRLAGEDVPAPAPYYAVRVVMPQPTAVAVPARRAAPRWRPVTAPLPSIASPAPPVNNSYEVQGDRSLVGATGR